MKKILQRVSMIAFAVLASSTANAQCPAITCPGDITINNDPGTCGAVVNYTTPVGTDTCSSAPSGGNILFVSDGAIGTADEIPAVLTAAGYTVTSVYNDHNSSTDDNATLQAGGLSAYSAIYWHASGAGGFGDTHSAATFTALSSYVNGGGAVFVTGYDVIASPTDINLITFLGGTSSSDGGTNGSETLVGANSLTTGVTTITGQVLNASGDHDGLNNLLAGTVAVASNGTSHGWTIRTLGAGEIALVSSANSNGSWAPWSTVGSGYHEALLNFASNHSCSSSNVLFVSDGATGTAGEIPAELTAAGYNVTTVYNDHNSSTKDNAVLQGSTIGNYSAIFWHASGNGGYGDTHSAATFTALSAYVNAGGAVFITGYDVIASPVDNELINFMGGTTSSDGGSQGTETIVGTNSLSTGVTNIVGLVLASTGDHDGLNNLQAGTVGVATNGTSHGWSIRSLGSGEIAWVSSANYSGQPWAAWNTAGSGYKEALLNFAFNHSCGGASVGPPTTSMTAGLADGATFPLGATTVTYEVVDGNGNNPQTCSFIVTVVDNEAPIADLSTLADVTADCEVTTLTAPTATDNCAATVTVTNNATLPITASGTTVVTWSYDDGNGNISTQDQNVIISDVTAPTPDIAMLADESGTCDVTPTAPTATDNCSGSITGVSNVTFPINTSGTTVVTWTYDDGNGNTSTQDQNVIVDGVDTGVAQSGATLTADATGVTYQWLDCDDSFAPIAGETNGTFTATNLVGNYAVQITENGCVDTSMCFLVDFTGLDDLENVGISIYPNPSTGIFTIESIQSVESVQILDIRGRLVYESMSLNESSFDVNISDENTGVYYVHISGTFGTITEKIVLQ